MHGALPAPDANQGANYRPDADGAGRVPEFIATRLTAGAISVSNCNHLPAIEASVNVKPVSL
jgi:hypothetical protein